MKKSIYDFKRKYAVQDELLNEGTLEGLDERTLHETIKAMLVNTTKDCSPFHSPDFFFEAYLRMAGWNALLSTC